MRFDEFGTYFTQIRKSEGYKNQRELALRSGISPSTISRIEAGTHRPTPETLRELANCFTKINYEELMQEAGYLSLDRAVQENILEESLSKIQEQIKDLKSKLRLVQLYTRGRNLNWFMEEKKLSVDSLANNIQINSQEMNLILDGKKVIPFDMAVKISKLYKLSIKEMFQFKKASFFENIPLDVEEILSNIDDLLNKERKLLIEQQELSASPVQVTSDEKSVTSKSKDISLSISNLSKDEFDYLNEQLSLFRKFQDRSKL